MGDSGDRGRGEDNDDARFLKDVRGQRGCNQRVLAMGCWRGGCVQRRAAMGGRGGCSLNSTLPWAGAPAEKLVLLQTRPVRHHYPAPSFGPCNSLP